MSTVAAPRRQRPAAQRCPVCRSVLIPEGWRPRADGMQRLLRLHCRLRRMELLFYRAALEDGSRPVAPPRRRRSLAARIAEHKREQESTR